MKRYLHFYFWLAAIMMMICSTATMFAQTKVTSLDQLKAGSVIKIYPRSSSGWSHYGESKLALACNGNGKDLTTFEWAGSGDSWTLVDAGGFGYYYLKNNLGCYWAYQDRTSSSSLTCTTTQSSAVKVSLTWDSKYGGVCFWNKEDGTGLNNLDGSNYRFNWWSHKLDYTSDANTTFDVAVIQEGSGESVVDNTKEVVVEGVKYVLDLHAKTAEVSHDDYSGDIVIPQSVVYNGDKYNVISLGLFCFEDCSNLSSISLPDGITSLGGYCFRGCSNLSSITLPESITSLGNSCFRECSNLSSITLPNGITSLGMLCFYGCSNLSSITLPESITSLGRACFSLCSNLSSITLPDGITSLGGYCFYGCNLSSITLPDGIISLENNCFSGCI